MGVHEYDFAPGPDPFRNRHLAIHGQDPRFPGAAVMRLTAGRVPEPVSNGDQLAQLHPQPSAASIEAKSVPPVPPQQTRGGYNVGPAGTGSTLQQ